MALPATPDLTLTVTPPGGSPTDYTDFMTWGGSSGQISITQNFGRQGDTASIVLTDDWQRSVHPNFYIPVLSQVKLFSNTASQTMFAGVCNDPVLSPIGSNVNEWALNCTDYTYYADNAIVHGTFYGYTVDQILISLTNQANCGISAVSVRNGGFVAPGPQLASFILNYSTLSDAWRKLAQLAGQVTPYGWYVDEQRRLHFYDSTTALNSGVTFTTSPTSSGLGSLHEAHYDWNSFTYEWDGTSVRNRILVQGANQTINHNPVNTGSPTDTWQSNGAQDAWPLRYTVTNTPILHVNGSAVGLTVVQAGSTSTDTWQVVQNNSGGWSLTTRAVPTAGKKIQIWYDYQVPIVARANDYASQTQYTGPNGGIYVEYINDTSLTTVPMALARALRERTEYAFAAERMSWTTTSEWLGWIRAGQVCKVINRFVPDSQSSYSWGLNDNFIIVANSVTIGGSTPYYTMQLTGVRI